MEDFVHVRLLDQVRCTAATVAGAASETAGDGPGEDRTDRAPAAYLNLSDIHIWNI